MKTEMLFRNKSDLKLKTKKQKYEKKENCFEITLQYSQLIIRDLEQPREIFSCDILSKVQQTDLLYSVIGIST